VSEICSDCLRVAHTDALCRVISLCPRIQVALITGANKGIGFEAVRILAEQQPQTIIYLGSRTQANGDAAVQKLPEAARKNVRVLVLDATSESSVKAAVARVKSEQGHLDVLINNAGILSNTHDYAGAKSVLDTNVYGARRVIESFLPIIPEQTGHISIVSSEVGTWGHFNSPAALQQQLEDPNVQWSTIDSIAQRYLESFKDPKLAAEFPAPATSYGSYGFSKTLVSTYGRALGRDLKSKGIPVLLSCPGYCATDLNNHGGHRPASKGGESVLMVLKRGVADSGKLFQDNNDIGIKHDMPDAYKQQSKKAEEASK